jgi:hypothetical protein
VAALATTGVLAGVLATQGPAPARPELGLFVTSQSSPAVRAAAAQLGVQVQDDTVYASGGPCYCSYSPPAGGLRLLLAVGALSSGQASSIAQGLVASGHADTIWRPMWEMNQDVGGWFPSWNQNALSPAAYVARFQAIVGAARAVPGANFTFEWNPDASNNHNAVGRSWNDTYPGDAFVDQVGVDAYDWPGYQANVQRVLAFAQAHHRPLAFPEWGLNGHDDPAFVDYIASVPAALQAYFIYGGPGINSDIFQFPASRAAYGRDFGGNAPPPTTTSSLPAATTTAPPPPTSTTTTAGVPPPVPAAPSGLVVAPAGCMTKVTLSWSNAPGTLGIDVFRDGTEIAWPGWPGPPPVSYTDVSAPSGTHSYAVAGYDSAGVGPKSAPLTVAVC